MRVVTWRSARSQLTREATAFNSVAPIACKAPLTTVCASSATAVAGARAMVIAAAAKVLHMEVVGL